MPLDPEKLELKFDGCLFGVSARRIHEHMTLAQINPFARSVASVQSLQDAADLIDLVRFDSRETFSLTGATLAGLDDAVHGAGAPGDGLAAARQGAAQPSVRAFAAEVAAAAKQHAERRAARNVPARFLPPAAAGDSKPGWTISGESTGRSRMRGCCTIIPVRNRYCLNGAKLYEDER